TLWSMGLANMGLTKILAVSVPVLTAIYPVAIMLIVLSLFDKYLKNTTYVYKMTILFTGLVSVVDALNQTNIKLRFVTNLVSKLPLFSNGLCWIVPAVVGALLGLGLEMVMTKKKAQQAAVSME
ncbi:MAG: branched-chain amino acid transport system II carrier protein, partial [Inconstantimicrobium porci]|uniref:branched-chain amino acid transport system II carrier protein n=1 Tax=Inconstantimicrobium porci TaxID=2652291 RepID=UPI002A911C55